MAYMGHSEDEIRQVLTHSNVRTTKIYLRERHGFSGSYEIMKKPTIHCNNINRLEFCGTSQSIVSFLGDKGLLMLTDTIATLLETTFKPTVNNAFSKNPSSSGCLFINRWTLS